MGRLKIAFALNPSSFGRFTAGGALILLISTFAFADDDQPTVPDSSDLYTLNADPEEFGFIEQQIYRGEADQATNALENIISQVESARHRYDAALVAPLTLSGDAAMVQQQYDKALDLYGRARHIERVNNGLFAPGQLAIIYREADAHRRLGNVDAAAQSEEYAYEVAKESFGTYDLESLPPLYRLADFYLQTYNYLAARSLYSRSLAILEHHEINETESAIPALTGIATSHKLERFPPFYVGNSSDNARFEGPQPGLTTSDLENQHVSFNNFPAGERALQQIVKIRTANAEAEPENLAQAILDLADWHMMFGRTNAANTLYTHVYNNHESIQELFNEPQLIYFPLPKDPKPPPAGRRDTVAVGSVSLKFDVSTTGRVRKLKTAHSDPEDLMDFRVRRSMRLAVYRPRLENGVPVTFEGHEFTHTFQYFPTAQLTTPASPAGDITLGTDDPLPESDQGENGS